jgi:pimeloyl-ACP methyl ester carboxylesterase
MRRPAFGVTVRGGVALVAASAAATVLGRSAERQWRAQPDPVGPQGLALPPGDPEVVVTDDGARLAVTICPPGDGSQPGGGAPPTVVLSHCWTGSRLMWAPVTQRLVDAGHRVVLYDQRGHGESTFGAAVTLSRFGDDLAAVLDHVDARDVVVAGHSMGGFAAMAFACAHRERLAARVRGLVLVSTAAHGLGAGRLTGAARRLLASGLPAWTLRRRHLGLHVMRGVVGGRLPCYGHLAASRDLFLATPPDVTAACFACFADMDLREELATVDVPSVVMIGAHDPLTPPPLSHAIVDALPSARLDVLEDAGHLLPLEAPDRVAAAIAELAAASRPGEETLLTG